MENLEQLLRDLQAQLIAEQELSQSILQAAELHLSSLSSRRFQLAQLLKNMIHAHQPADTPSPPDALSPCPEHRADLHQEISSSSQHETENSSLSALDAHHLRGPDRSASTSPLPEGFPSSSSSSSCSSSLDHHPNCSLPNCSLPSPTPSDPNSAKIYISASAQTLFSPPSAASPAAAQGAPDPLDRPLKSQSESGVRLSTHIRHVPPSRPIASSASAPPPKQNMKIRQSFRRRLAGSKIEHTPTSLKKGYSLNPDMFENARSHSPVPSISASSPAASSPYASSTLETPRSANSSQPDFLLRSSIKLSESMSSIPTSSSSSSSSSSASEAKRRSRSLFAGILRSSSFDNFSSLTPRSSADTTHRFLIEDPQIADVLSLSLEFLNVHLDKSNADAFVFPADAHTFRMFFQRLSSDPLTAFINTSRADLPLIASLIKFVFANSQMALLTHQHLTFENWSSILQIEDPSFQLMVTRSALKSLTRTHHEIAQSLFTIIHARSEAENTAICNIAFGLGPQILREVVTKDSAGVIRTVLTDYYRVTEFLIRHSPEIFACTLQLPYTLTAAGYISNATFHSIIDFLLDPVYCSFDPHFVDTVLFTYSYFTTSRELLATFAAVYSALRSTSPWQQKVRHRILWLLKKWLVDYVSDLQHEPLSFIAQLCKLLQLAQTIAHDPAPSTPLFLTTPLISSDAPFVLPFSARCQASSPAPSQLVSPDEDTTDEADLNFTGDSTLDDPSLPFIRIYGLRLLEFKKNRGSRLVRNISYFYQKKVINTITTGNITLRELMEKGSPMSIAQTLTLIDHGLFKAIPSGEFLKASFQDEIKSPHFAAMTHRFNLIGKWFAMHVVASPEAYIRAIDLGSAISIAFHCFELRNYNTCFAILAGLNSASVSRMKITWELLSKRSRRQYQQLSEAFEMSNNFNSYRTLYAQAPLPKVPYLMLYPKDLIAIEDNNPTLLEFHPSFPSINFEKMRLLWGIFSDILKTQLAVYSFPPTPELHVLLTTLKVTSDDEIWARSLISEPR